MFILERFLSNNFSQDMLYVFSGRICEMPSLLLLLLLLLPRSDSVKQIGYTVVLNSVWRSRLFWQ